MGREKKRGDELVDTLMALANVCLQLDDIDAAERHLNEAQLLLQSFTGGATLPSDGSTENALVLRAMNKLFRLQADCAEHRNNPAMALEFLQRAASLHKKGAATDSDL